MNQRRKGKNWNSVQSYDGLGSPHEGCDAAGCRGDCSNAKPEGKCELGLAPNTGLDVVVPPVNHLSKGLNHYVQRKPSAVARLATSTFA